jgi:hypothetical protein
MPRELMLSGGEIDEAGAAALAAVAYLLDHEDRARAAAPQPAPRSSWRDAARLSAQGVPETRPAAPASWGRVERLRRAGRGGGGIVGL